MTQGSVRLTEADPYSPEIYLRATGRRYGYDLTMEVDGAATQPDIVFTSSPALDSEQVLLMVMTGASPTDEISNVFELRCLVGLTVAETADVLEISERTVQTEWRLARAWMTRALAEESRDA